MENPLFLYQLPLPVLIWHIQRQLWVQLRPLVAGPPRVCRLEIERTGLFVIFSQQRSRHSHLHLAQFSFLRLFYITPDWGECCLMLGLNVVKEGRDSPVICLQLRKVLLQSRHRFFYPIEFTADGSKEEIIKPDNAFFLLYFIWDKLAFNVSSITTITTKYL